MMGQQEDPILKTVIQCISNQRVQDLKHLLGYDTKTEDGKAILQEWKKFMLSQGASAITTYQLASWKMFCD